jgi:hypothetical protein
LSEQTGEQPDPNTPDTGDNGNTSSNDDAAGADVNPNQAADTPEAPVPAEPQAVQVQPADQSEVKTDKVFDKDYEVTPERGYRVQKPTVEDNPSDDS